MEILDKIAKFLLSKKFYAPVVIIIISMIINIVFRIFISKLSKKVNERGINKKRETIINLITNLVKYVIVTISFLCILNIYGVNTSALVASLSVVSVVIGLAFQDTIKNMLSGIFMILDNRYNVNDFVKVNDFTGAVLELGLQTTKIKGVSGEIFTISNSKINTVINYSQSDINLIIEIPVSADTNLDLFEKMLKELEKDILSIEGVLGDYKIIGIDTLKVFDTYYKISVKCKPSENYKVKIKIIKLIKGKVAKNKIETPFNKIVSSKGK